MISRFFRNAEFLIETMVKKQDTAPSLYQQWKQTFCLYEIKTLPNKISIWGRAINYKLFAGITPEQLNDLVVHLQALVHRIEELFEAKKAYQAQHLVRGLDEEVKKWYDGIMPVLQNCSNNQTVEPFERLQERLQHWLMYLEDQIEKILYEQDAKDVSQEEIANFYRLVGGLRGVSTTTVSYAELAAAIDLTHWREERFS
jgi:hypothetical protein